MTKLKRQINIFIIPTKNTWWILKLTGNKIVDPQQLSHNSKTKAGKLHNGE
jgi:hypothetical protein